MLESITSWLDPMLGWFAQQAGLSNDDYVSQTGGEGIAVGIELIADLFTKGLLNKAIQAGAGAIVGSYAIWGKPPMRLRKELITIANHMEMRLLDPKPSDVLAIRKSIDDFLGGVKLGNNKMIMDALFTSVEELQQMFEALGIPTGALPLPSKNGSPIVSTAPVKRFTAF